ncbi:PSD1 and planctomycete cytochrome C domain-containing protein [Aeoliella sp. ICT_H6.2]|uniref:PSD1 and planctomycete cytochrome C domain-containing protein n=1 Tax=Aeoliella straminimaris TaxID=2954799 RepID=A0A9X2FJW2_9BACT|nr:PSD1 and planctomycete cytochrome C domain-containing protein [Aeoliella straminimaris]MCO6047971.1 PSD1 and planctomycete cytochrome C domain-containing protein [Aeoliella straminimaris]
MSCHGGVKKSAGLSFVYRDDLMQIIEPGEPDDSSLIERVESSDEDLLMPPAEHGPALSREEIDLLRRWISQGATWDAHWSLSPPQRSEPPEVENSDWCRTTVDRWILARLESEGISPSPEEMPGRWLRRVSLDLIGLPPTPEEGHQFEEQARLRGEAAYEAAVDRLLASPHFGERWATAWLDQVRYADSRGLGFDNRRNAWKYRDWVIRSFNDDLPFDQFTVKQLAGDLLPDSSMGDIVATACHRLTQTNDEGGTDDEEFRVEAVLDRVNTTWQVWQGMTYGCARCHDHPYEPFTQEDYYRAVAFFNNSRDCDLSSEQPVKEVPINVAQYDEAQALDEKIESLRTALWEADYALASDDSRWQALTKMQARTNNSTKVTIEDQQDPPRAEFHTVGTVANNTTITLVADLPESKPLTALRVHCLPLDLATALRDSEWGFMLSHVTATLSAEGEETVLEFADVIADEPDPFVDPSRTLDGNDSGGFATYSRIHHPRSLVLLLKSPVRVPSKATLTVNLVHNRQILASFSLLTRRGYLEISSDPEFLDLLDDQRRLRRQARLENLVQERRQIRSTAIPVMQQLPARLSRPTNILIRGSQLTKGDEVLPGVPATMTALPGKQPATRLDLAHWLVDDTNPLTARVTVNRYWARLFGTGLVETEEDFGSAGTEPSHPGLLDNLALAFRGNYAWSTKRLLRELVLSSTYRQSSVARDDLADVDPHNRLLARGPRTPLTAEMVRDNALAVSGLLSPTLFGEPVHPPIPAGVWKPFQSRDQWKAPPPGNLDRYRRAIYTYTKRSIPYPMQFAFDAPSREFCTPRRIRSNTPTQALMTLNDKTFVEFAEELGQRMQQHSDDLTEQLTFGFEAVTARAPTSEELSRLKAYVDTAPGDQAMTMVASVLLNLDEALTK